MIARRLRRARAWALALAAFAAAGGSAASAAVPPFQAPRAETRTLANGLRVAVIPAPGSGLVAIQMRIPAGVAADPAGGEGASALAAQLLTAGTTLRNAERINADLLRLGTTVETATGPEFATVSATFLARDADEGAGLVSDLVLHPLFPDEEYRRAQRIAIARTLQPPNPAAAAQEQAVLAALPGHPAGRPAQGTSESLSRMRREDVRAFHRDRYQPAGAAIVFSGDLTPERGFALAEEWLGAWSGRPGAAPVVPPPATAAAVRIVERAGTPLAELRIAWAVPGRSAPDRAEREFAAELFARELAGRRSAWSSALQLFQDRGVWMLSASVPVDSAAAAARAIRRAFADFVTRPRPAATIREGARLVRALHPLGFETVSQRASRWLLADFAGDSAGVEGTFTQRIAKVTPAEVQAAAARGLDLEHPVVAAAGPAARLEKLLASYGKVQVIDPRQEETRGVETATAEEIRRGRNLVEQAIAAHGGEQRLRDIHETIVESEMTLTVRGETANGRLRQVRKDPDRLKLVTSFGNRQTFQVLSGRQSWSLLPGDTTLRVGDSTEVAGLRATFRTDPARLLRAAADSTARLAHRGRENLEGRESERVDVVFEDGGARRMFFDPVSRRLLAVEALEPGRTMIAPTRWLFADYRQVQGVWWPHDERRLVGGEPYMQLRTVSVQFNPGVSDEEFQAPTRAPRRPDR